ncbi:SRPBCC family protein [Streptomyces atratus]|uniref:Cyclase/dehydrase n=1 Tax=Streptomyces atratus TaxID=1893 RepID=A0A2Z5JCC3_STRAR|nr:SRPBCC family protein [Streptomyces atratus]AXE77977.1 cyclase/dehydrase [Streptomyces atratus]
MRSIHLLVALDTENPSAAFGTIADFTRFADIAEDIHVVETHPPATPDTPRDSDWEVNFRRGIMRWNEAETLDPERLRIEFDQTDGDFEEFRGSWQLAPAGSGSGTEVRFEVTYDFGIESLVGIMDPIAERVIKRAICSVLEGLFGSITVLEGGEALTDLPGPSPEAAPSLSARGGA